MPTFTETRTSPTDVLNRLQEVEVVLQALIDKVNDLEPGEGGGDVSALQASLERLYRLTVRWSQPDTSPSEDPVDVTETTIFDGVAEEPSLFSATFGQNTDSEGEDYKDDVVSMGSGEAVAFYRQVFPPTAISRNPFLESATNVNLMNTAFGSADNIDNLLDGEKSIISVVFGNDANFETYLGRMIATRGLAGMIFGSNPTTWPVSSSGIWGWVKDKIADLQEQIDDLS